VITTRTSKSKGLLHKEAEEKQRGERGGERSEHTQIDVASPSKCKTEPQQLDLASGPTVGQFLVKALVAVLESPDPLSVLEVERWLTLCLVALYLWHGIFCSREENEEGEERRDNPIQVYLRADFYFFISTTQLRKFRSIRLTSCWDGWQPPRW
jgi:hypothetical protein